MKSHHMAMLGAGLALEWAHSRVRSGAAGGDSNTLATIEGQLANLDEIAGPNLRVGLLLIAIAVFLFFYR